MNNFEPGGNLTKEAYEELLRAMQKNMGIPPEGTGRRSATEARNAFKGNAAQGFATWDCWGDPKPTQPATPKEFCERICTLAKGRGWRLSKVQNVDYGSRYQYSWHSPHGATYGAPAEYSGIAAFVSACKFIEPYLLLVLLLFTHQHQF